MSHEDPSLLLDALSTRVLRSLSHSTWRKVFLRPHHEVMQFAEARGTFLAVAMQLPTWSTGADVHSEIAFLAATHGGELDPCPGALALVRFEAPGAALRMALDMQHMAGDVRFQVGLASGDCVSAGLQVDGHVVRVLVGGAADRADAVARMAAPGSIRFAPEVYAQVQDRLGDLASCMVTTEYEGDCMMAASVMLPPRSSQLSTFAGLGLT